MAYRGLYQMRLLKSMSVERRKMGPLKEWLMIILVQCFCFLFCSFSPLLRKSEFKCPRGPSLLLLSSVPEWPLPAVLIADCISVIGIYRSLLQAAVSVVSSASLLTILFLLFFSVCILSVRDSSASLLISFPLTPVSLFWEMAE